MTDDYTEDATPSQQALDSQLMNQKLMQAAQFQGQLGLARSQIVDAVADGADAAAGRELLGRLDQIVEFPDSEDPVALYAEHKAYIRSAGAAPQAAAQSPTPPKKVIDKNRAREDYVAGKITTAQAEKLGIV